MATRPWSGKAVASFADVPASAVTFAALPQQAAAYRRVGAVLIGDEPGHIVIEGEARQDEAIIRYQGSFTVLYPDGSLTGTVLGSADQSAQPMQDHGQLTVTAGAGAYAGATGTGTYRGHLVGPFEEGAVTVYEIDASLEVPD
jgi:hypothetical protein